MSEADEKEKLAFSKQEIMKSLGVSDTTLWRLMRDKSDPLPHVKLKQMVLFPVSDVREWMKRRTVKGA